MAKGKKRDFREGVAVDFVIRLLPPWPTTTSLGDGNGLETDWRPVEGPVQRVVPQLSSVAKPGRDLRAQICHAV